MEIYGRRVVIEMPFDAALHEVSAALGDHGFSVLSRVDVREHLACLIHADVRRYVLLQVAMPRVLRDALHHDSAIGAIVPTPVAVFELADGETAVVVSEPFGGLTAQPAWRRSSPRLAALADETCAHMAAALEEVAQDAWARAAFVHTGATPPAPAP